VSKKCRGFVKCIVCGKRHPILLCPEVATAKALPPDESNTTHNNLNCTEEVLLGTLFVKLKNPVNNKEKCIRAVLDNGSQRSYVLKKTVQELGFNSTGKCSLNHLLFGGSSEASTHKRYVVNVHGMTGNYSREIKVLDQD